MKISLFSFSLLICLLVGSCKDSQYVVRQTDKNLKYQYAHKWYMAGKYQEAIPVIENVMTDFKGTDTAANLYFMLADCYFQSKEYFVAAYHFKSFRDIYPRSYKAEVAAFKIAECYKNEIPRIELEQTDNHKAINYYNTFISEYPRSPMVEEAYREIEILNRNLERKALQAGDLYYKTKNYRAAAVTYKNVIGQYPKIKQYEELLYKIGISYYKFAEKSTLRKQSERYEIAINECKNFINRFPNSSYVPELKEIISDSRIKTLESALKKANTYYILKERPLYFDQAIELYEDYVPEIKLIPSSLHNYKDKCYLGTLKSYYLQLEAVKDAKDRIEPYNGFTKNYYNLIDKFKSNSPELIEAEDLYTKVNKYYKL